MRAVHFIVLIATFFTCASLGFAQRPAEIVQWSGTLTPPSVSAGRSATANISGAIKEGWHVYAISQPAGGPKGVTVRVPEGQEFTASGAVTGTKPKTAFDKNFNMNTEYYENTASLKLPLASDAKATAGAKTLKVDVRFQTCNDRLCLPPTTAHLEIPVTVKY